jgi:hypothetical protein
MFSLVHQCWRQLFDKLLPRKARTLRLFPNDSGKHPGASGLAHFGPRAASVDDSSTPAGKTTIFHPKFAAKRTTTESYSRNLAPENRRRTAAKSSL